MAPVSNDPQRPGWWQASDGRWYPPEASPGAAPAPSFGSPPPTAGKATATLVLAIVSFVACPVLPAIAALVVGAKADREIREAGGRLGGEGLVKAGRILAIVHLGLSVLMIPLMAAIAIPTFLGAQERAQDRAVQSDLRNALVAERVYHVDHERWTDDPAELAVLEPSLTFQQASVPRGTDVITVVVEGDIVALAGKSESGTCFYLSAIGSQDGVGYAEDDGCGAAEDQEYLSAWE